MRHVTIVSLLCALGAVASGQSLDSVLKDVDARYMKQQLKIIASDKMEGRDTGTPGNDRAAAHIRKQIRAAGLKSLVEDGSFYQPWALRTSRPIAKKCKLLWRRGAKKATVMGGGRRTRENGFQPHPDSGTGTVSGSVVFAGYGITAEEHSYDDYAQVDVKNKVVLVFRGEPRERDTSGWNGRTNTAHAAFEAKIRLAKEHGAKAIIFVTNPVKVKDSRRAGRPQDLTPRTNRGRPVPITKKGRSKKLLAVWMDYEECARMVGGMKVLSGWEAEIDKDLQPRSQPVPKLTVKLTVARDDDDLETQNICAVIRGTDETLKDEYVILGAHYDHVGVGRRGGSDKIFNGADDNGSGTVTLMTVARALGKARFKPKRSIVFLWFSGEEKGLLGAEFYVGQPLVPLQQTVAMINMDMVGRNYDSGCQVIGTQFSPRLREVISRHAEPLKMDVEYRSGLGPERILERSDQAPFYKKDIPIAFFTTGLHKDYHKVSDHWDLIKYKNMSKIGQLILKTTVDLANGQSRPEFVRE